MFKNNKKYIFIAVVVVLVGVIIYLSYLMIDKYNKSPEKNYPIIKKEITDSNVSEDIKFDGCDNQQSKCLVDAVAQIREEVVQNSEIYKLDKVEYLNNFNQIINSIGNNDYISSESKLKTVLSSYNEAKDSYNKVLDENKSKIEAVIASYLGTAGVAGDYKTKKIIVSDNYSITTITSGTGDDAKVILKYDGTKWSIIAGPGTDFDIEYLNSLDVPQIIKDNL